MRVQCLLGNIAPVDLVPDATLKGDSNSKRWIIDIEYDAKELVTLQFKFLDYRTGKIIPSKGRLKPSYAALNRAAAYAAVFFPVVEGDRLACAVERGILLEEDQEPVRIRLTVDAVNSLTQ
jgi:hypothetical protein